jgi:hypothetical protein
VQRNNLHKLIDGTMTFVPDINFLPWVIFAFINDSIDCISTLFSGSHGDYKGAASCVHGQIRQCAAGFLHRIYQEAQHQNQDHFLPNGGISTLFGPVSAWQADAGLAAMSNLNAFLVFIQRRQFFSPARAEVLFTTVGDLAFNLGHQCFQLYYRTFAAAVQLTNPQKRCNTAMRLACVTIEKTIQWQATFSAFVWRRMGPKIVKESHTPSSSCMFVRCSQTTTSI